MRIAIDEAVKRLKTGVVAIPTETVYGLAASLNNPQAIEEIFLLKGRPRKNPLIIHLSSAEEIADYAKDFPPGYEKLLTLWPGSFTLILNAKIDQIPARVRADLTTAAFRVPALPLARELLKKTGPLVIPSANLSGRPSSTDPAHVEQDFGVNFPVLDGGMCHKGLESTILAFGEGRWRILRQGALPQEQFMPILGYLPEIVLPKDKNSPECPGQLFKHYSPKALLTTSSLNAQVVIGFKERSYTLPVIFLGSLENPAEAAHHLYDVLRQLDEDEIHTAQVDLDFPTEGLWSTIRERLLKAMQG